MHIVMTLLAAALSRGALPRLQDLDLRGNGLGSAGLIALAPGLRAQPQLKTLSLVINFIGDDGVAARIELARAMQAAAALRAVRREPEMERWRATTRMTSSRRRRQKQATSMNTLG